MRQSRSLFGVTCQFLDMQITLLKQNGLFPTIPAPHRARPPPLSTPAGRPEPGRLRRPQRRRGRAPWRSLVGENMLFGRPGRAGIVNAASARLISERPTTTTRRHARHSYPNRFTGPGHRLAWAASSAGHGPPKDRGRRRAAAFGHAFRPLRTATTVAESCLHKKVKEHNGEFCGGRQPVCLLR